MAIIVIVHGIKVDNDGTISVKWDFANGNELDHNGSVSETILLLVGLGPDIVFNNIPSVSFSILSFFCHYKHFSYNSCARSPRLIKCGSWYFKRNRSLKILENGMNQNSISITIFFSYLHKHYMYVWFYFGTPGTSKLKVA